MDEQQESRKLTIMLWAVIIVILATFIWCVLATIAIVEDSFDESVVHTSCEVTGKKSNPSKQGMSYRIDSTCGQWFTHDALYNNLKIGETYNLETTKGNWAHKPYLRGIVNTPVSK
jgi:hypothetical protein